MKMTERTKKHLDARATAIDNMLLTKRRLLTEGFLRELIVLRSIYAQERIIKNGLENAIEQNEDIDYAIESFGLWQIITYTPAPIKDLLVNLKKNGDSEIIDVTPEWINKVFLLYDEVFINYLLCLVADKFSD